jgi:hypothetical protein
MGCSKTANRRENRRSVCREWHPPNNTANRPDFAWSALRRYAHHRNVSNAQIPVIPRRADERSVALKSDLSPIALKGLELADNGIAAQCGRNAKADIHSVSVDPQGLFRAFTLATVRIGGRTTFHALRGRLCNPESR